MDNTLENTSLRNLMQNPSQLADIIKDPTKGLDFYKGLSVKEQQYLLFAAAFGLIGYAIYLGRQEKQVDTTS
ncbi:hypothetical protein [Pontibacter chinhatensis]|uniref:Uncharacterized protein n=1 Tax=Pontibacter chinhatensis TaxID=1436961 RepID=A0A1I2X4P8_9BACT|nr:hypothetical protein [Pontibacter chinhatensis]SFH06911.1 hypothetical protein SAMN05421739_105305 [Pontibacter chinhatensis]